MTRLATDIILPPVGMDATSDATAIDPTHAQLIVNMLADRAGELRGSTTMVNLTLNAFVAQIDGVGWFYGQSAYYSSVGVLVAATTPNLLVVTNGSLTSFPMVNTGGAANTFPPTFTTPGVTKAGFIVGQRVRFFGFGKEVFAVQNLNGFNNYRIEATGALYQMGVSTPLSVGTALQNPTTPSHVITNTTGAAVPIDVTSAAHGFSVGQPVWIQGVTGNTNANGFAYAGTITPNTFELYTTNNGITQVNGAVCPQFSTDINAPGAFTSYTFTAGDTFTITSGIGVITGTYAIQAKMNSNDILLASSPSPNTTGTNIVGYISSPSGLSSAKIGNGAYISGGTVVPINKTGVVQYAQTFVDQFGRESDLSNPVQVDFGTSPSQDVLITATGLNGVTVSGQVASANIYATAGNGTTFYLIANLVATGTDPTFEDNLTSQQVQTGQISAAFGENAIPLPASLGAVHHNRVFLNSTLNQGVLQISNSGSPTQFASTPQNANDGETFIISSDQGNIITGLISFGSMFAIFLRRGLYVLEGDDYTTWDIRQIHDRGCIAPDSVVRADNHVCFLSDDGVYVISYIYRVQLEKFSKPIEIDLQTLNATVAGRKLLEAAQGAFVNNCYYLAIGNIIYVYNFDTQGWVELQLTGTATVTSMNVAQNAPGSPGLLYVGRSDDTVSVLDIYTLNQTVNGMVYLTRIIQSDPSDQSSKGQFPTALRKRIKRIIQPGFGTITSGSTITVTMDNGRTEVWPIPTSNYPPPQYIQLGALIYQEFSAAAYGEVVAVQLNLNGTGIILRPMTVEMQVIG